MMAWLLMLLTVVATGTADDEEPTPEAIHQAVEKALPSIVKSTAEYPKHRDCFSCHHQGVPALALSTAKQRGLRVEAEAISDLAENAEADLRGAIESYKKGEGQGGGVTRAGYAMLTLEISGRASNEVTDAVVTFFLKRDESRGHWRTSSNRPPSEASDLASTYLAVRALAAFGKADSKDRIAARTTKAREWLESAKPKDTEDRVFRLFALKAVSAPAEIVRKATDDLLATRRGDGAWAQLDGGESDAYATGSALVALHQAGGLATDDRAYRRALKYLIGAQRDDGTWFVKSRSKPFQPYFESGFPYGKDQFISMAATAWATTALALACPKP
jgi:Squalene-hopene cyclase C-terminal domain